MTKTITVARIILICVAASYLLSAALLAVAKWRGQSVAAWMVIGWLVTGIAGVALSATFAKGRGAVWIGVLVAMGPWMVWSLIEDLRRGYWAIAVADLAAIGAIGYALMICRSDVFA